MKKSTIKLIAGNAILAALYAALTVAISPISYGNIQFRLSEILIFLAFYDVRFIPGLILGCSIANLFSPLGLIDVLFGTLATTLAVLGIFATGKLTKRSDAALFSVPVVGAIPNGLLVALSLHLAEGLPYWLSAIEVAAGEFAVLVAGALVFLAIGKIKAVRKILCWEW